MDVESDDIFISMIIYFALKICMSFPPNLGAGFESPFWRRLDTAVAAMPRPPPVWHSDRDAASFDGGTAWVSALSELHPAELRLVRDIALQPGRTSDIVDVLRSGVAQRRRENNKVRTSKD